MIGNRWFHKPPLGYGIDGEYPLSQGIRSLVPCIEGTTSPIAVDLASGAVLSSRNGAGWGANARGPYITSAVADAKFVGPVLPATFLWPMTVVFRGSLTDVPTNNSFWFGLNNGSNAVLGIMSTGGSPFGSLVLSGGSLLVNSVQAPQAPNIGQSYTVGLSVSETGVLTLYQDGVLVASGTVALSQPSGTGYYVFVGENPATPAGRIPLTQTEWGGIWGRVLSPAEHMTLATNPWLTIEPRRTFSAAMWGQPYFAATPASDAVGASGQSTITLTGKDKLWSNGSTTFTISGIPGATVVSQSIADHNDATIVVSTGSSSGTLTISDGTTQARVSVAPIVIVPTPAAIPTGHPGHITINLAGTLTSWSSGSTTFTLSGVPGVTKVSQTINSATSAQVVVTTGSGTGNLVISDGTAQATVAVQAASIAIAPAVVGVTGTFSATLTGTNTIWTQESASPLVTFSGVSGASLSNIAVQSDTHATATLTVSGTAGTATITDASTGAATPVVIEAVPSGSLHVAGRVLVGTAASESLFGGQASASLEFSLEVLSNAGLNLASGTTIIGWGTNAPGGAPFAVYYPAAGELVITAYGAAGTSQVFRAVIPIQLGIGYQFILSWSVGSQVLYLNGVPYVSASISAGTYAYQQIRMGGDAGLNIAGNPVAVDHRLKGVAIWSGHAITSSEATARANGSSNPLNISAQASAWWPLGGGTAGAAPSLSDPWMADLAGGGNTLSVLVGSLSGSTAAYSGNVAVQSPVTVGGEISKCGKLAIFTTTGAAPSGTGAYPAAPIIGVTGTPTVYRNRTAVAIGPPVWATVGDCPFVTYLLQCGSVQSIAIADGGHDFTSPTASASGGGGSGLVLGTPNLATGVARYSILNGGTGFGSSPVVAITDQGGSGLGATAYAVIDETNVFNILLANGGHNYINPIVSVAIGHDEVLAPSISGGALNSIGVTSPGAGYPASTTQPVVIADPTGSGAQYTATINASGGIAALNMIAPGSNYTNPTIVVAPLAGIAAATQSGGVVAGINILAFPAGYPYPPTITLNAPILNTRGPQSSIQAVARAVVQGGAITHVVPFVGGLLGCGSGYSASAPPTATVNLSGSGALLTVTVNGSGNITGVTPTSGGTGYPSSVQLNFADATGTGATATAVMADDGTGNGTYKIASVTMGSGGSGYSSHPSVTVAPAGNAVAILPLVSNYVASIPVTNGGSNFTGLPTITLSDSTGAGAILMPIMTGVSAGDTLTYSAPASWLTPTIGGLPLGGLQAVTGAPMDNWAGRLEGPTGNLTAFSQSPTMLGGASVGEQPATSGSATATFKNRLHQAAFNINGAWTVAPGSSGSVTLDPSGNGMPLSWSSPSSTVIGTIVYGMLSPNYIDQMGSPSHYGQWTLQYDDTLVNQTGATAMWLGSWDTGFTLSIKPLSLSGPNLNTTTTIAVDPRDITFDGNSGISAITLNHTTGIGTGWQGCGVLISDTSGSGAAAYAVVSGGTITRITMVCNGSGYSANPTIQLYGTAVSGTQITAVFDFEYISNPYTWDIRLSLFAANAAGSWSTIRNPWVVTPDVLNGNKAVASIDRTKPFATDDNVIKYLNTANGKTPGALRFMDVAEGFGGVGNLSDPPDLFPTAAATAWSGQKNITVHFQYARYFNTDPSQGPSPGSGTYAWLSNKLYGTQPWAASGTDSSFTTYGSSTGSLGTATPYLTLAAYDAGRFTSYGGGSAAFAVIELRSTTPHGLRSAWGGTISGTGSVPIGGGVGAYTPPYGSGIGIWVTGPYTILISIDVGAPVGGSIPQTVSDAVEHAINWAVTVQVPAGGANVPYEYTAAMVAQFPNCALWCNLPPTGGDALIQHIAQVIAANIGPTNPVYLEFGNENWNTSFTSPGYFNNVSLLMGYLNGPTVYGGYLPTNGHAPTGGTPAMVAIASAQAFDVFEAAWVAAGMSASRLKRVYGSNWDGSDWTLETMQAIQQFGISGVDFLCVATYFYINSSNSTMTIAFTPAGAAIGGAGSWPADAMNDLFRWNMAYSQTHWSNWQQHAQYCQALGQPLAPGTISTVSSSGGSLAGGNYYAYWTFVDSSNRETTVGLSQTGSFAVTPGSIPGLATGAWPSWAAAINIYLTQPGGAPGAATFYKSIPRSGYTPTGVYSLDIAQPTNGASPPVTNLAAANTPTIPALACYEGGATMILPRRVPFQNQLYHDSFAHPSARDLVYGWYAACQQGNPTVPGGGAEVAMYYEMYDSPPYPDMWVLAYGSSQPPGDGLQYAYGGTSQASVSPNRFATIQGGFPPGFPPDGHDHNQYNTSPALQGFRDWINASSSGAPTVVSTTPTNGAVGIGVTAPISVAFNDAMDPTTLTLNLSPAAAVAGPNWNAETNTASWTPIGPGLKHGTVYTPTVNGSSTGETAMAAPQSWSFTTQVVPPAISGGVASISINFGVAINATDLSITATISNTGASFPGTVSYTNGVTYAIFTPTTPFVPGTPYLLYISGATVASDGSPIAPETLPFNPGPSRNTAWFAGLGKPVMRLGR